MNYRIQIGTKERQKRDVYTTKEKDDPRTEREFIDYHVRSLDGIKAGDFIKVSKDGKVLRTYQIF